MEIWENKKWKAERNQNGWGHNASWVIQIAWNWAKCVEMKYFSHGALYFLQIKGFSWNLEILRIIHIFLTCYTIVHMYCATDRSKFWAKRVFFFFTNCSRSWKEKKVHWTKIEQSHGCLGNGSVTFFIRMSRARQITKAILDW